MADRVRKSNLIKKTKTMTVYVYSNATAEERKEAEELRVLGWTVKPVKENKEDKKPREKVEITAEAVEKDAVGLYDIVGKEDMVDYIKKLAKAEDLKAFAVASHKNVKGEVIKNKDGNAKYFHISAKRYFFETYFKEAWDGVIKPKLDERTFKTGAKKKMSDLEAELLDLI